LSLVKTCSLSLTDQIIKQLSLDAVNKYCSSALKTMSVMPPMCAGCSTFLELLVSIGYDHRTTDPLLTLSTSVSVGFVDVMSTPKFLFANTLDTFEGSGIPLFSFFSNSAVENSYSNFSLVITNILLCVCDMYKSLTRTPFLLKMSSLVMLSLLSSFLRDA